MPKTKDRVAGVAGTAKPYVERALHDEELRDHVKQAYAAATGHLRRADRPARRRRHRHPGGSRRGDPGQPAHARRRAPPGGEPAAGPQASTTAAGTLLLLAGVAVGLLYNPVTGPRRRAAGSKDELFGGGDEFGYDSGPPTSGNGSAGASGSSRLGAVEHRQRRPAARPRRLSASRRRRGASVHRALERAGVEAVRGRDVADSEQDRARRRRVLDTRAAGGAENGTPARIRTSSRRFQASRYVVGSTAPS